MSAPDLLRTLTPRERAIYAACRSGRGVAESLAVAKSYPYPAPQPPAGGAT